MIDRELIRRMNQRKSNTVLACPDCFKKFSPSIKDEEGLIINQLFCEICLAKSLLAGETKEE